MIRRPPRSTRTDTLFPYTTLFRSIDDLIVRVVEGWLGQADLPVGDEEHPDVPALRAEVRKARRRLDEIAEMLGDGDLDPAGARKARVRAMARLTTAEGELSAVTRTTALSSVTSSADPVQAWRVADLDVRREVIRELMEITVERQGPGRRAFDPDTIRIRSEEHTSELQSLMRTSYA